MIHQIRQILPQLHTATVRRTTRILRTIESRQTDLKKREELLDNYKAINPALAEACALALKQNTLLTGAA